MSKKEYVEVGTVKAICRYPVKSLGGDPVQESWIGWHGLDGDRRFAFAKLKSTSGFPWLTARDAPQLVRYSPYYLDPQNIRESVVRVKLPDGRDLPLRSSEFVDEVQKLSRTPIHLLHSWSGIFDAMDLSVISCASIDAVKDIVGMYLELERFRPNILVDVLEQGPFMEDRWIKGLLRFGNRADSARVRINRKTTRCMVVNLDCESAKQTPKVLKEIVRERKNQIGVYGTTERPGTIRVEDSIYLLKA